MNERHIVLGYAVVVRCRTEDFMWVAEVPDLTGCTAEGDTSRAALSAITLAMSEWFASARDAGRPIPPPTAAMDTPSGQPRPISDRFRTSRQPVQGPDPEPLPRPSRPGPRVDESRHVLFGYEITLEREGEWWHVTVPKLAGCSTSGTSPSVALQRAKEAMNDWFSAATLEGRAIPYSSSFPELGLENGQTAPWTHELMLDDESRRAQAALSKAYYQELPPEPIADAQLNELIRSAPSARKSAERRVAMTAIPGSLAEAGVATLGRCCHCGKLVAEVDSPKDTHDRLWHRECARQVLAEFASTHAAKHCPGCGAAPPPAGFLFDGAGRKWHVTAECLGRVLAQRP